VKAYGSCRELNHPMVSVIILNYNGRRILGQLLSDCLSSVLETSYPNFEVIFVDNGSTDDSVVSIEEKFGKDPRLKIIRNERNLGFAEGNNVGAKYARGEYIVFLNNDIEVDNRWLKELINIVNSDSTIGAAQSKLLLLHNRKQFDCAGGFIDYYGYASERGHGEEDKGQYDRIDEIFYAKGAAILIRHEVLESVGLFDPDFIMYYEETDLCWRIWLRGYRIVFVPTSIVYHATRATVSHRKRAVEVDFMTRYHLTTMIKNYNWINLMKYLSAFILIEIRRATVLIMKRNTARAKASIKAFLWNLFSLKYIWKKRLEVQLSIRRVPDTHIMRRAMLKPYPPFPHRMILHVSRFANKPNRKVPSITEVS